MSVKTEIKTVRSESSKKFEEEVNELLSRGWELHGEPQFRKVALHDTWDGRHRGWSEETFVQVLKRTLT